MTKCFFSLVGVVSAAMVLAQPPESTDSSQPQNVTRSSSAVESITVIVTDFQEVRQTSSHISMRSGTSVTLVIPDYDDHDLVKDLKCSLTSAVDETGRNLVKTEKGFFDRSDFNPDDDGSNLEITVKLKNAARRSSFISMEGTLDLFIPSEDPASTISVASVKNTAGTPIQSDTLKSINASVVLVPPKNPEENDSPEKAETDNSSDKPSEEAVGAGLAKGLEDAFSKMFAFGGGPNAITLEIVDPENKIQGIEFFSQEGHMIRSNGSSESGDGSTKLIKTLDFEEPLPENTEMRIYVLTEKSQRKIPFHLPKIVLP